MMSGGNQYYEAEMKDRLEAATKRAEKAEAQVKNVLKLCDMLEERDNSSWQNAMAASFRNAIAEVTQLHRECTMSEPVFCPECGDIHSFIDAEMRKKKQTPQEENND